jgi:membrane protease YdiL (CAAX protease family)
MLIETVMINRYWLLALPVGLIISTALVFTNLGEWLGQDAGYILGFVFYWVVWCYGVPLMYLGVGGFTDLFRERVPLLTRRNLAAVLLLVVITLVTVITYFIPGLGSTTGIVLLIAIPIEIVQGAGEEVFWRGLFLRAFPHSWLWGWAYPAGMFAVWHLSPTLIFPAEGGSVTLVVSAFVLGLAYGWIARQTGSIRWIALSHILNGLLAFGIPISTSLQKIVGV